MSETLVTTKEFKDSPIGKIPKDWDIVELVEEINIVHGYAFKGEYFSESPPGEVLLVPGNFHREGGLYFDQNNTKYYQGAIPENTVLSNGDLLIVMTDLSPRTLILGRVVQLRLPFKVLHNQRIGKIILRLPDSWNKRFLMLVMNSNRVRQNIISTSSGTTVRHTSPGRITANRIPKPGLYDQDGITEIIDTIDKAIALTDTHITKLKKAKAGLLHDLLTRGIDEHGELRDYTRNPELFKRSALGIIPKDWDVQPAENICLAVVDCKNRTPPVTDEGHPVIRTTNIKNGNFIYGGLQFTDHRSYLEWTRKGIPRYGNILITREAPVGEVCLLPEDMTHACLGQRMMMYQVNPDIIGNDFILLSLLSDSVKSRLLDLAGGSTVGHVRVRDIRTQLIHVPPLYEQVRIVECLKPLSQKLSVKVNILNKFKLLKKGLMSDLLTGRVRVKI